MQKEQKPLRIAFDALPLVAERMTGIGYCEAGQIQAMLALHPEEQYRLQFFDKGSGEEKRRRLQAYEQKNAQLRQGHFSGYLYRLLSTALPIPYRKFFGTDVDLTHFFNYIIPPGVAGKKVVTVHDMVYKTFPETVRGRTRFMLETGLQRSLRLADCIVTDSAFSKEEILRYFPNVEEKIRVVPCGVDRDSFYPMQRFLEEPKLEALRKKMGLQPEYLLYVGTLEPRKNLARLLRAYAMVKERHPDVPQLVLAGGYGWKNHAIYALTEELHLTEDVLFTEYVPAEDLRLLFCGAMMFVFPSFYEGFGMPPLEAMACGTPVLCSAKASLPEVVGNAAVFIDPQKTESIAEGMERLLTDAALRERLQKEGLQRAAAFSWENSAAKLYNVYREVLQ